MAILTWSRLSLKVTRSKSQSSCIPDNLIGFLSTIVPEECWKMVLTVWKFLQSLTNMTPWKHAESSVKKWGGKPEDYVVLHDWFDETKQFTGDWTHRALRHHSAGIQWAIEKFGHIIVNSNGQSIPTKMLAEQHVTEDCGFIPTPADYLNKLCQNPEKWMLTVGQSSKTMALAVK